MTIALVAAMLACIGSMPAATAHGAVAATHGHKTQQAAPPARCVDALSRILPGAFDYCLARQRWDAGWYTDSVGLMRRAAAWGNKDAQLALGVTYFNGDHVPANRPLGLAWLGLAAERHEAIPLQLLTSAYAEATSAEKRQAQALMDAMWSTYADATAAVKADRYYVRALHRLNRQGSPNQGLCLAGLTTAPTLDMGQELRKPLYTTHYTVPGSAASPHGLDGEFPAASHGCPSVTAVVRILDTIYASTMRGWAGEVTVGDPQTLRGRGAGRRVNAGAGPASAH